MSDFNFVVGNDYLQDDNVAFLFGGEPVTEVSPSSDIYDILVLSGIFPSKSQARKNWKRTGKDISPGWTELRDVGKLKSFICIWNPIPQEDEDDVPDPVNPILLREIEEKNMLTEEVERLRGIIRELSHQMASMSYDHCGKCNQMARPHHKEFVSGPLMEERKCQQGIK